MNILGLSSAAQVIVLQGLSTYAALASAYLFARPILRGQVLQNSQEILDSITPENPDVKILFDEASNLLSTRAQMEQPSARLHNFLGALLLLSSFLLFTGAVALQVSTDPSFHEKPSTDPNSKGP